MEFSRNQYDLFGRQMDGKGYKSGQSPGRWLVGMPTSCRQCPRKTPLSPGAVPGKGSALGDFFVGEPHEEQRENGGLWRNFPTSPDFFAIPEDGKIIPL